ncbi:dehydrogenase E1 component superfamily protein [Mycobacterium bohemicum DSM 44277]|uniref:Dehydrogenase E1 component superfamily protein n=1 Tax=Mycobacterium bohemicum DSM 44277 TaxID=1236609 RepID=A0A0U0W992_MYCBE|nr:thiamine pyrophosphate-dependent enzyme [Mycobacterium bohemicum]MCV6969089.1 dehydrogenase [Mycobacterium bohemicum]CPR11387.1 dehydrogenase E1 component superfamily protein [Mycobacterium bohemicum DSM 44277]
MARTLERPGAHLGEQLELYRRMWVLRLLDMALEESRIDGLLEGPTVAAFGQEAVAVGTIAALRPGDVMSTAIRHFRHAQQVGLARPLGPVIVEMLAPGRGVIAGPKDGPLVAEWKQVFASPDLTRQSMLFALGDSYAQQVSGEGGVTVCVIGDDAVDSAEFKSVASVALSWRLPVVFVVETVRDASGVRRGPREHHGLPVLCVDGRDVVAVNDSVVQAVQRASTGGGPTILEAVTYRTNHPVGVDPLVYARQQLTRSGVGPGHLYEVERRARQVVGEASALANALLRGQGPAPTGPLVGG